MAGFKYVHVLGPALLGACLCLCLIEGLGGTGAIRQNRASADEVRFHLPAVIHFSENGSLADYPSATAPGYHLVLAGMMQATGMDLQLARRAGAVMTVAFLLMLAAAWARATAAGGAWLALPAAVSLYVVPAGVWLLPDNLAWLTVLGTLWIAVLPRWNAWHVAGLCGLCLAAVAVRQSNAWLVLPAMIATLIRGGSHWPWSMRPVLLAVIVLPALGLLAYWIQIWGGLTPPAFQGRHAGFSLVAPAWLLLQFAACALFYLPLVWRPLLEVLQTERRGLLVVVALAMVLALIGPSDYSQTAGRWSGLWQLVPWLPVWHERSLLVLLGAVAGAVLMAVWLRCLEGSARWVVLAAVIGFCAAQSFNHYQFDRYYVGFVLLLLPCMALAIPPGRRVALGIAQGVGVILLFAINGLLLYRGLA